jgi:UDP-2,3-diacylglucosamine pyrophosphatase LpxH
MQQLKPQYPLRSVFVSDVHLGAPYSHAEELAEFLSTLSCERLFLVGDIVDLWWLAHRKAKWHQAETRVIDLLRRMPRRGIEVIYIPGNHDAALRSLAGQFLAGIPVRHRAEHSLATGRRILVTHGDQFDRDVRFNVAQKALGGFLYDGLLDFDAIMNSIRKRVGMPRFSLAQWIKSRSGRTQIYIQRYENAVLQYAKNKGFDGAVCGHIHQPQLRALDNIVYANCGDWVENLTAIVEDAHGTLMQIRWRSQALVEASEPNFAYVIENFSLP